MFTKTMGASPIQLPKIDWVTKEELESLPVRLQQDYVFDGERNCYFVPDYIWAKNWRKHGPYYYDPSHPNYIRVAVGGSDIAAGYDGSKLEQDGVINLYPGQHGSDYSCKADVVYTKAGHEFALNPPSSDVLYVGHLEEDSIRKRFAMEYQRNHPEDVVAVHNDCHMYQCGVRDEEGNLRYPFILCDLDGIVTINGETGILECKTCSIGSPDYRLWKKGIVPLKYYLQICYYMICMDVAYGYIACKWGISESEFVYIRVERNAYVDEGLLAIGKEIADATAEDRIPDLTGQNPELIAKFWRKVMGPIVPDVKPAILSEKETDVALELNALLEEEAILKEKWEHIKERKNMLLGLSIFPKVGKATKAFVPVDRETYMELRFKNKVDRSPVDENRLQKEQPKIYERYCQRKFNQTAFCKENKVLAEDYKKQELTPGKMNYLSIKFVPKSVMDEEMA